MTEVTSDVRVIIAVAGKDWRGELRSRQLPIGAAFFGAVTLFVFGFALGPDRAALAQAAPGLLWLALILAGMLVVSRLQQLETDDGAGEQLALYPASRGAIYLGKVTAALPFLLLLGAVLLPATAVLYSVVIGPALPALVATIVLGSFGFAAVGTFYAGLTARMRAREILLPLLLLPVIAPLLLAAVRATVAALAGDPFSEVASWLGLLAAFDLVMVAVGAATYGTVLEE